MADVAQPMAFSFPLLTRVDVSPLEAAAVRWLTPADTILVVFGSIPVILWDEMLQAHHAHFLLLP